MTVYASKPDINVREKLKELESSIWCPPSFRVDLGSVQTVANVTHAIYQASTVHWDTHNAYNAETYTYVIPISGIYLFNVTQWWSNKAEGRSLSRILINDIPQAYHYELSNTGGSWTHQSMHSLNGSDRIQVSIYQDSGNSQNLDPSNLNNGWTGVMVSGHNYGKG